MYVKQGSLLLLALLPVTNTYFFHPQDVSELRNELQRKEALIQKHLSKLRHWQQVLEDISVQHKKPAEMPQGPLAYLEQASANIPAPMKQTWKPDSLFTSSVFCIM